MHRAEKTRDTTLDDEKYNLSNIKERCINRTCVVVTMLSLCNQPEAFTSDLSDDWSRYLLLKTEKKL